MANNRTYTVPEFVALCKGKSPEMIEKLIDIKTYIDINKKREMISTILESCKDDSAYLINFNPIDVLIKIKLHIVDTYTNVRITRPISFVEYDMLEKEGLFDLLVGLIGEDVKRLFSVQDMMMGYALQKNNALYLFGALAEKGFETVQPLVDSSVAKINEITTNDLIKKAIELYKMMQ